MRERHDSFVWELQSALRITTCHFDASSFLAHLTRIGTQIQCLRHGGQRLACVNLRRLSNDSGALVHKVL